MTDTTAPPAETDDLVIAPMKYLVYGPNPEREGKTTILATIEREDPDDEWEIQVSPRCGDTIPMYGARFPTVDAASAVARIVVRDALVAEAARRNRRDQQRTAVAAAIAQYATPGTRQ